MGEKGSKSQAGGESRSSKEYFVLPLFNFFKRVTPE